TNFVVFFAFYALLTTLPIYVMNDLGGTQAQGGLIVTSMLVSAIIVRIFSGNILTKFGKRNSLLWGTLLFTLTQFLYIWVSGLSSLLTLRFIHGISFGILTTATNAIAADLLPEERKGEGLGYFALAMNVAMVVGPFLGLTLLQFVSFNFIFIFLSVIMIGGLASSFLVQIPGLRAVEPKRRKQKRSIHDFLEVKALPVALISCLVGIAYS